MCKGTLASFLVSFIPRQSNILSLTQLVSLSLIVMMSKQRIPYLAKTNNMNSSTESLPTSDRYNALARRCSSSSDESGLSIWSDRSQSSSSLSSAGYSDTEYVLKEVRSTVEEIPLVTKQHLIRNSTSHLVPQCELDTTSSFFQPKSTSLDLRHPQPRRAVNGRPATLESQAISFQVSQYQPLLSRRRHSASQSADGNSRLLRTAPKITISARPAAQPIPFSPWNCLENAHHPLCAGGDCHVRLAVSGVHEAHFQSALIASSSPSSYIHFPTSISPRSPVVERYSYRNQDISLLDTPPQSPVVKTCSTQSEDYSWLENPPQSSVIETSSAQDQNYSWLGSPPLLVRTDSVAVTYLSSHNSGLLQSPPIDRPGLYTHKRHDTVLCAPKYNTLSTTIHVSYSNSTTRQTPPQHSAASIPSPHSSTSTRRRHFSITSRKNEPKTGKTKLLDKLLDRCNPKVTHTSLRFDNAEDFAHYVRLQRFDDANELSVGEKYACLFDTKVDAVCGIRELGVVGVVG